MTTGRSKTGEALAELRWYFGESEGDAAGLRAVTWNVLEEVDPSRGSTSGPSVKRGAPPMVDPHPDERAWARTKERRVHDAFRRCSHAVQAVLEAHLLPRKKARIPELGTEYGHVAALLPEAQALAEARAWTRLEAAQELVQRQGYQVIQPRCVALVATALDAYVRSRFPQLQIPRPRDPA